MRMNGQALGLVAELWNENDGDSLPNDSVEMEMFILFYLFLATNFITQSTQKKAKKK